MTDQASAHSWATTIGGPWVMRTLMDEITIRPDPMAWTYWVTRRTPDDPQGRPILISEELAMQIRDSKRRGLVTMLDLVYVARRLWGARAEPPPSLPPGWVVEPFTVGEE